MTLVLPARTHGKGETESFRLTDDARQIRQVRKETRAINRASTMTGLMERIQEYVPVILPGTDARDIRLRDLGMTRLADAERTARRVEMISYVYPELADESYDLWNKFLPTRYEKRDFAYDSVPDDALDFIEMADRLQVFDRIVIWSPEGNDLKGRIARRREESRVRRAALMRSRDPMAVGVVRDENGIDRFFSIVRWGESLLPVEEIAAYVKKVDRQENRRDIGIIAAIAVPVLIVLALLIALVVVTHGIALIVMGIVAVIGVFVYLSMWL